MANFSFFKKSISIRNYSLFLVFIYLIILPLIFIFNSEIFVFSLNKNNNYLLILFIMIFSILFFIILFNKLNLKLKFKYLPIEKIIIGISYGFLFAFSEELIFRGLIQNFIKNYFENFIFVLFISSLIFGIAHLPNGADFNIKKLNYMFCTLAFFAGLFLGFLYEITSSLFFPILLHTIFTSSLFLFYNDD